MKTVIFACVRDAGRSKMAATFFNELCAPALVHAISAGTQPADRVQAEVEKAMKEIGFDLGEDPPRLLTPEILASAHLVVTLGFGESRPVVPIRKRLEWPISDPWGESVERVRQIRDDIRKRVWRLLAKEGWYKLQPINQAVFRGARPRQSA